ncbi:MAG: tRNA lysidine(34) synthetase TilS [Peptoniphilaceae bacterium]|nr:tRNA lysidine(34) synthetase TilS [Peptoniphilaceae bacterium]
MKIIDRVRRTIVDNHLIEKGDTVVVGASGGPDSEFLITALNSIKDELGFDIVLAHLNHLHRKEAIVDQKLVEERAKTLNLKVEIRQRSMDDYARENKLSPEDAGRRLRYDFFEEVLAKYPKGKIAVAHTFDDQAETVFMRIIRGTGIKGLTAMSYKNGSIIRPILDIKKSDLLSYLDQEQIPYAIDQTNLMDEYTRNKLRLDIIPAIEKINPNFKKALVNLSDIARDELEISKAYVGKIYDDILISNDETFLKFDREGFDSCDKATRAAILRQGIEKIKGELNDISKDNIESFDRLVNLDTGKSIIKDDITFYKSYNYYELLMEKRGQDYIEDEVELNLDGEVGFGPYTIKASKVNSYEPTSDRNVGYFDYDKLDFPLKVRYRRNGDRFKPLGMTKSKKLKDFLIDSKIDRKDRDKLPIITSASDIIWVVPLRMGEDYKVSSKIKNIVRIEVGYVKKL